MATQAQQAGQPAGVGQALGGALQQVDQVLQTGGGDGGELIVRLKPR